MNIYEYSHASIEHPDRCDDATVVSRVDGAAPLFAVIDGMGGHQRKLADGQILTGRDAAQLIRRELLEKLSQLPPNVDANPGGLAEQQVIAAIKSVDQHVFQALNSAITRPLERVGAVLTVVVVCEEGRRLLAVQAGDTRAYLYSGEELIQLCVDEDSIEHLVREGTLSAKDAAKISAILNTYDGVHEPQIKGTVSIAGNTYDLYLAWRWFLSGNAALNILPSNMVINAVGIGKDNLSPMHSRVEVEPGDVLCLCSDGLYKNLTDDEIAGILHGEGDIARKLGEAAVARSEERANQRSTPDDISVVVVRF